MSTTSSTTSGLSATELLDGWRIVGEVLGDHAAALDRLEAGDADDGDEIDGAAEPAVEANGEPGELFAGSDLAATVAGAVAAASGAADMSRLWTELVRGADASARGRAGRDLVEVLEAMSEVLRNADRLDAERFALALEVAAERLAGDDDGAHPGCLSSVVAASAAGALAAVDGGATLADAVIAAADEGLVELEAGPVSHPDLVERGVVDAAAAGYLLLLDTLASVITGEPLPSPPPDTPPVPQHGAVFLVSCRIDPHEGCGLESANWLESTWYDLGELVEFEGLGATWRAALVTSLPGSAVEAIFEVGRPRELHIGLAGGTAADGGT